MDKWIVKYKNAPRSVKASIWFVISDVLLRGVSFITLPVFSRILSTEDYGIVSVYQSWVSIISILCTLTIWGGVFNVEMVQHHDESERIVSAFQGLATTVTLFFLTVTILGISDLSKWFGLSPILTIALYLEIFSQIPYNLWSSKQRYFYRYKGVISVSIFIAVLNPLAAYFAIVSTYHKAEARILTGVIIHFFIGVIFFALNQYNGKKYFDKDIWKYGSQFNMVLIPHYLSMQILDQSDRLMINKLCGSSEAGIYSVAYNFAILLTLVANGINSSFTPHIYKSLKENNAETLAKQTNGIVSIVAVMALGLICFVPDLFHLMLPGSYHPAIWVIPPVTVGAFFKFLHSLFGSVEFYYEENKYVTIASIIGAVVNVIMNYIFINIFGFIAAAYTTMLCYLILSISHYVFMKRVLKKRKDRNRIYDINTISLISLILICFSILMTILYENALIRRIAILIILILSYLVRKALTDVRKVI